LPFAPHLTVFAERLISGFGLDSKANIWGYIGPENEFDPTELPENKLQELLLSVFRLLVFDQKIFAKAVSPLKLQALLQFKQNPVTRYLAIRVLCIHLHAANHSLERLIHHYTGGNPIIGDWENKSIDYRFLSYVLHTILVK